MLAVLTASMRGANTGYRKPFAAGAGVALGASVITPPFDVPYSRMAVLRDPQGATFTVSRFTPPD